MSEKMVPVIPKEMKMFGMPIWFHHHGTKVTYIGFNHANAPERTMLLKSSVVKIEIYPNRPGTGYIVFYVITQSPETNNTGQIWMDKEDLEAAFGMRSTCEAFGGQWLADKYGADVAHQGKYIRYGNFLNIPSPGTGSDGDPNVSLHVDEKMREAIKDIILK